MELGEGTTNIYLQPPNAAPTNSNQTTQQNQQNEKQVAQGRRKSSLIGEVEAVFNVARRIYDAARRGSGESDERRLRRERDRRRETEEREERERERQALERERERDREREKERERERGRRHHGDRHRRRSPSSRRSSSEASSDRSRSRERRRKKESKKETGPIKAIDPIARGIALHADEVASGLAREREIKKEAEKIVEREREKEEKEEDREAMREEREARKEEREERRRKKESNMAPIHPLPTLQGTDWRHGVSWAQWGHGIDGPGGTAGGAGGGGIGNGRIIRLATASPDGERRGGNHIHVHTAPLVQGPQIHSHTSPPINVSSTAEGQRRSSWAEPMQRLARMLSQTNERQQAASNVYNHSAYANNLAQDAGINMSGGLGPGMGADMRVPLGVNAGNGGGLGGAGWYQVNSQGGNNGGGVYERAYAPMPGSRMGEREWQRARVWTAPSQGGGGMEGMLY